MNKEEFIKELAKLNISVTNEQLQELEEYTCFLITYNEHTNLTAIKDSSEIYLKHFYDSLTIVKVIDLNKYKTLLDVGTGAGFPGLVLKIMYPHLEVTLLDSNNKKITFLNILINKLGLKNIVALQARSEIFAKTNLDKYDIVTARAVSNMKVLTELCLPLVKIDGYFIALKGDISKELEDAKPIISKLKGQITNIESFTLPKENAKRTIIKVKKDASTPLGYPRNYNKICKN